MSAVVGSFKVVEMSKVATEVSAIAEILEAVKVSVVANLVSAVAEFSKRKRCQ